MKLNNIIIFILTLTVFVLTVSIVRNNTYMFKSNSKEDIVIKHIDYKNNLDIKVNLKDILQQEIRYKNELITMELDVVQKLQWDESWGDMNWFKKTQDIEFFGTGIYTVDLQDIKSDDIEVDDVSKTIILTVSKPSVKLISLSEDKTSIGLVEKGLLRFGDVKMGIYENELLRGMAKEKMEEQLNSKQNMTRSMEYAQISLHELFLKILYAVDVLDYTVNIYWK